MSKYYFRFVVDDEGNVMHECDISENIVGFGDEDTIFEKVKETYDGKRTIDGRVNIYLCVEEEITIGLGAVVWRFK